ILFDALVVVWMANLYNFMDGADGLAGAMGVIGFLAYGLAASLAGADALAVLAGTLSVCCAAFLAFNLPPARLFMGDIGSAGWGWASWRRSWAGTGSRSAHGNGGCRRS